MGIEIITAHSSQAKGRVECNHAVYQDRFVRMLRIENILIISEANIYLPKINTKFTTEIIDGHVLGEDTSVLETILCHIKALCTQ